MRLNSCRSCWSSLLAGLAGTLAAGTCFALTVPPAAYVPPALPKAAPAVRLLPADAPSRMVALPAPTAAEQDRLTAANALPAAAGKPGRPSKSAAATAGKGRPLAVGYGRDVPAVDRSIAGADLEWQPVPEGGQAARIDVSSEGAAAVRFAIGMNETDPDVTLRFAGSQAGASVFGPYPANRIAETSRRDGVFWSPVLDGSTGSVEIHLPAGVSPEAVQLRLARVSHLAVAGAGMRRIDPKLVGIGGSDTCEIDVACVIPQSPQLANAASSVAKIVFTQEDGVSYACTATLINDTKSSSIPYLFTASHCLNSQYAATNMNSFWFFDAIGCRNLTEPPFRQLTEGATMLGRSDDWDWGLVRLNSPPPAGVMFSAWSADPLPQTLMSISTLHHPMGDLKKWSQGTTQGFFTFEDGSVMIRTRYSLGSTEPGSSGSGLLTFFEPGGYYVLRGGLYGGDASCRNVTGSDYYSRMDAALPLLRQYLTPDITNQSGTVPVVEFYNINLRHYFLSIDPAEINDLDTGVHVGWERTGLRFLAYANAVPGTSPVCRFYEKPGFGDSHFYSADPAECAETAAKFADHWIYESPNVFHIARPDPETGVCPAGTRAVWRYFNSTTTNHRYTTEVLARDEMAARPTIWTAEGYGLGPYYPIMCSPVE